MTISQPCLAPDGEETRFAGPRRSAATGPTGTVRELPGLSVAALTFAALTLALTHAAAATAPRRHPTAKTGA